eukprot:COSAG06_NODE_385_length_16466_cov_2.440582_2_plen_75_part_00
MVPASPQTNLGVLVDPDQELLPQVPAFCRKVKGAPFATARPRAGVFYHKDLRRTHKAVSGERSCGRTGSSKGSM